MPTSIGPKERRKDWITMETLEKIDGRKNRKAAVNNSRTHSNKIRAQAAYTDSYLASFRCNPLLPQTDRQTIVKTIKSPKICIRYQH